MNKLQLYIYKSLRGFKSVRNINPAENIQRHIRDVRAALGLIGYDPAEKHLFYLLSYIDEGFFLSILRTIPDKKEDHLATTIFIPRGLQISAEELGEIVHRTTRMVSNPAVTVEELNELHEVFSREYPYDAETPMTVGSEGREYAFSYYGGETTRKLEDFLGERIYQTSFIRYAGVMLIDAALEVPVYASDLTDKPLCEPGILLPPQAVDGFTPGIFGRPFDRPFRVSVGDSVEVIWRRTGFDNITQTVKVTQEEQSVEGPVMSTSRKTISPATFYITSQGGKNTVSNAEITVNGVMIEGDHPFTGEELEQAEVVVHAPGYQLYKATLDLAATSQALISLSEQRRIYRFELPVKSSELGSPIKFEIHTKRTLTDSPLEGYSLVDEIKEGAGKSNHLEYIGARPGIALSRVIMYVCAAIVGGFLLGWLLTGINRGENGSMDDPATETEIIVEESVKKEAKTPDNKKKSDVKGTAAPADASANVKTGPVAASAIAYLDNNAKWNRDEMEKQPGLSGLFDDMNNYRLERLSGEWADKLSKSSRFERVAKHARESLQKKVFVPEGTYCTGDADKSITVQLYLYRIDPAKK